MTDALQCWKCGAPLDDLLLPLARQAECPACRTDLHVCRMCLFHEPSVAKACREPVADPVADKTRANFCGYFQPSARAWREAAPPAASRAALDALFGAEPQPEPDTSARSRLDELFRK